MPIKLLAIDLDGTLLTHDKRILAENAEAIRLAQEAGVTVVLASGRIPPSMAPFAAQLGLDAGPMISGNGTLARTAPGIDIYRLDLSTDAYRSITEYAWVEGLHLNIYTPDRLFFLRNTAWGDLYKSRVEAVIPELLADRDQNVSCIKVLVVADPGTIHSHRERILGLVASQAVRATESEPEYLEFMHLDATKGYALQKLGESLGIRREDTAAIGDYLNDVEMLQYAGLSAAVGNAHPTVKNTANMVVSSNDRGGVSEFIRQFVLKQYE
jgi:Cof subfamily protein (haloacid dehalogenase superfamily)